MAEESDNAEVNIKVNGGSGSDEWSSSSDTEVESEQSENGSRYDADSDVNTNLQVVDSDVNIKNATLSPHLSNEISSHCDESVEPNMNLNGDVTPNNNTTANDCTKKVRPLKICFGVKNSINGLKKNAKISKQDVPKVHYIQRSDSESDESPETEAQPEYAQYLGLTPSVKFKCSRCGTKNFSTMALLKEHVANCTGQTLLTAVTSVPMANSVCKSNENVNSANLRITRKVFLCSSCGTYYQSYDLFIHMREIHHKQICLFCFNMFCRSQQLSDHLLAAHNLQLGEYSSILQIRNAFKGSFYVTCCTCNRIFSEDERFDVHECQVRNDVQSFSEPVIHTNTSVTEKLPSSESDHSLPASPLSPLNSPPQLEDSVEKEATLHGNEGDIDESVDAVSSVEQEAKSESNSKEHSVDEENRGSPNHPPEMEEARPEVENVADEEAPKNEPDQIAQEEPANDNAQLAADDAVEMDTNETNNCGNHSVKGDSSDSDTINALFDQSNPEEPEEVKVAQPLPMALMLDDAVASLSPQTLIRECVRTSCTSCTFCNNAVLIAVNGMQLAKHLLSEHRYKPTKNEDDSEQVTQKIESVIPELEDLYMNASSNEFDGTFVCFQCSFSTTLLKELCAHKRKAHQMNIFLCIICKCNFYHYSELLCHECPGEYSCEPFSLRFRCCFCSLNHIPSAFRLVVHLRKFHKACDYCLLRYNDQYELFSHMTKQHKMHHLCYKCNLAYRSRNDISKHLFWKHGTESVLCKRCLQKKWPHAYHFCMPASTYSCEECNRVFSKPVALTVHRRAHAGEFPFACECDQRFISKRLLASHQRVMHPTNDGKDEANASHESTAKAENDGVDGPVSNEKREDGDDKKRRKKKRKKTKVNEKPLLDELPPLNLSSESDDESPEDEAAKSEPLIPPQSPTKSPSPEVATATTTTIEEKPPSPSISEPEQPKDSTADDLVERALNCLLIEHSYCIPDSIFHSESVDGESRHKTPDPRMSASPHKHDAKCCKSTTPHKRKRTKKNSSGGESSSSGSSSDSDSSSSSCGSNCSCNRSNSNCSSSSSASDYSTTPEKKKKKKKKDDESLEKRTQEQREQLFLLDARESDLDTEISSAGEEFYEKRPCFVPPGAQSDKKIDFPAEPEVSTAPPVEEAKSRSSRKDKKKKKKRIKLNLTGRIPPGCNPLKNFNAITVPRTTIPVPVPNNEFTNQQLHPPHMHYMDNKSFVHSDFNATESYTNSDAQADDSNSGRLSKRKRVKNKFYGYSSSDDASRDSASVRSVPKKRVLTKKSGAAKNRHFVGIRAKQLPPLPKQLAISVPFTPLTTAHTPDTRPSQPSLPNAYNPYRNNRFSSSEDSDSDEKRHTLVINLPTMKEKPFNSYRPSTHSDESMSSSCVSSPRTELPAPRVAAVGPQLASQVSANYTNSPLKNGEKLYCYCQCPYDEVSEMIGCDAPNCKIEWFHFECVGIMVPPKGKWYCPSCRRNRENVSRFL